MSAAGWNKLEWIRVTQEEPQRLGTMATGRNVNGIRLYNNVEGYGQISVNDTWMKCLAMHPYLYAGFDYNFKYLGNTTPSTSNTGEYLEVGLRPSYRLPGIPFLKIFSESRF